MSGSPFSAWALNERTVNETFNLAKELNCPQEGSIPRCLGQKSVTEIWSAVGRIVSENFTNYKKMRAMEK